MKAPLLSQNLDALPICLRSCLAAAAFLALPGALMADLSATFNAASDVPVTASSYTASGAVDFTLNFAPEPGTNLTVVKNTGLPFIDGAFTNLANGATVNLSFNGTTYPFLAWYYGGEGNNDLVLLWPYTKVAAWGKNDSGQVGDGTVGMRYAPVAIHEVGLKTKTIVQVVAAGDSSFALTTEGRVYSWGSNDHDVLGTNAASSDQLYPLSVNAFAGTSALFGKTVVAIAGGASHCLALCSDGTVTAWGLNINGQVGDGTNTQRSFPVAVNAASGVSALFGKVVVGIAAGNNHSLALCSDGTLAAWGGNSAGQLGNNTTTDSSVPVLVNAADGTSALFGKTVASIESATSHNLALCTDGTLVSWGSNASGQLGDNSTTQRLTPVVVNTVSGTSALFGKSVEIITAGGTSCLALCSDGTLVAWGSNTYGQLGDNSNIGRLTPVAVNTDSGTSALHGKSVRLIAAGGTSSLALCSDGTLAAWGDNTYGQLGINTTTQRLAPAAVNTSEGVSILAGRKVRQISGASVHQYHYLAVHGLVQEYMSIQGNGVEISHQDATPSVDDHTYFGQANLRGASIARTFKITNLGGLPLTMSGTSWVQVSGAHAADFTVSSLSNTYLDFNESRTFRVTFDPTAIGVRNAELSIANNTVHSNPFTFTIQGKSEDPEITVEQPAGTELSTNGVTNFGEVFPGDSSELVFVIRNTGGDGSLLNGVAATLSGTNASQFSIIGSPVTTLAGPDGSTSFVVRFTPISGGGARTAMLSITSNDMDENPYQIQLTGSVPSSVSAVFSTSSDVGMTLGGLRATGMPVNLTLNFAPEPGTNLTVIKNTGLPFIDGAFSNLANGATVNLSFDGTSYPFVAWYYGGEGNNDLVLLWPRTGVASWGPNSSGQLGDKTTLQRQVPGTVAPIIGPYIQTIVQVAAGHDFMVALSTHGELYAWGNNINKQVGYGFAIPYFNYPTYVGDSALFQGRKAVAVAAGHSHSLALFSDGDLIAWGAGSQGQLGNRSTVTSSTPVWVSDQSASSALIFKSVVAIAAGGNHSLALCSDGTLAAWGDNQYGQLGDNTTTDQNEPKAVNTTSGMSALFGRKVIAISAGSDHSLVQCSDGTLVAWGRNTNGQLGINTTVESRLPVLVSTTEGESALFGRTVVSMIASGNQSRALCSDGTMVAWGSNNAGSLGEGTMTDRHAPVMMNPPGGGGVLQGKSIVAFTGNQALCSDGTLAAWGNNQNGQVGDDSTTNRLTPVAVNTDSGVSALAGRKVSSLGGPGTFGSPSVAIYGMELVSIIGLSGNGSVITHGDTTPSSTDHTDFDGANVTGGSVVRTFSVRNLEYLPLNLTGTPKVIISGPHASDFTVTAQPTSPVGAFYGTSNFQITFNPAALGQRLATVSIPSDDTTTPVYTFDILGRGLEPQLAVEQPAGTGLVENDTRDFRKVPVGAGKNMIFTVRNTAAAGSQLADFAISLDGVNAGDFSVVDGPDAPVAGLGGQTTFTVRFSPQVLGPRSAALHLASNDPDESPFDIQLSGEGFVEMDAALNGSTSFAHEEDGFTAAGATLNLTLNFAPAPGTNLSVIKNTGPSFIEGAFANVPNGGTVNLTFNGVNYSFIAWYYGGEGNNDLVLLWPKTMLAGWGSNTNGQLAISGGGFFELSPRMMDVTGVLAGKTIVQVAQGQEHCLALTTEGKVYAWGEGAYGQLGVDVNNTSDYNYPIAVNTTSGLSSLAGKTVVAVAAATNHSLALCSDGTVNAWGLNANGELGNGGTTQSRIPVTVDMSSASSALMGKSVTAIAAGQNFSLALCSDGTAVGWGSNHSGQLGDSSAHLSRFWPVAVNRTFGMSALFGKAVVAVAAGTNYSMALCSDGTIASWGENDSGQLGDGTMTQRQVPVAVDVTLGVSALSGKTVTAIALGNTHSMALCSDGTVAAWGGNSDGQIGDGTQTNRSRPVAVSVADGVSALFGKTVTAISNGANHSLALCSDGTLALWGDNGIGQLGVSGAALRTTPFQINTATSANLLVGQTVMSLARPMGSSQSSMVVLLGKPCDIRVAGRLMNGNVVVGLVSIADGDTTPSQADKTDFGNVLINTGSTVEHSFIIANDGLEPLSIVGSPLVTIGGPHASNFVLSSPPSSSTLGAYRSAVFRIRFQPLGVGVRTATVTILSNDPDEAPFDFTIQGTGMEAEIEVRTSGLNVNSGSTSAFGDVGVGGGLIPRIFVINNLGNVDLTGLTITKSGQHPQDFEVVTLPTAPVAGGGSTSLVVHASPKGFGARSATLQISNNDSNENPFYLHLTATGISGVSPVTDKPAVTGITFDGATLKAVVNASNSERRVFFDYGTTTSYGSRVAAVPGTLTGSTLTNVSAVISGLLPNTLYHFRVRAEGVLGSADGADKTFTTLNRPPVAVNDTALALPSGKISIPVLDNDSDAGDVLNVASFTPPAASVGSVAKVGSGLVFTPAASFAGGSFTYMAGDSYRAKSTAATVTVALASCTIGPDVTIPADSPPYELSVSANAPWTVVENVSWLSFVPPAPGASSVTIIPVPNASKTSRTAVMKVGGQTHTVTQTGVGEVPVLTVPSPIPLASISASYELSVPTQNGPVTYTTTGLPKGLTLSNLTGKITGYPTEAKTSTVTVKAKNVMGDSNTISFGITVLPFPPTMAGSYSAIIEGDAALTDKLGGLMTMAVTSTGGVTGTLKLGASSHTFTGRLNTAVNPAAPDPDHAVLKASVKRTGRPNVDLTIHMNTPGTDLIAGEVTLPGAQPANAELAGSRHVWHATSRAADDFKGYFTVALQPTSTATDIPQGDGFLTFTISPAGAVSWSGQLADGTVIPAQSAALWVDGRLPLFALLYGGKGSLHQHLSIAPNTRLVTGSPQWHKKPQTMRAYGSGFEPTPLLAVGGEYLPPVAGKTLLNRTAPATFVLDFLDGGINGVRNFIYLDQVFTMSAKHVLSTAGENPEQVKLMKIDVAKGTFTGSMTLKDTNPHNASLPEVTRPVTFQGVLVPSLNMGTGYFLLPSIIGSPVNVKTSPMTSGQVRIQSP